MQRNATVLVAMVVMAAALARAQTQTGTAPDVYLVTLDTLRADHVHCYGDTQIQTPAIDSLAREGIRFAQAFTPSPLTNSAHTSILTGLLPSAHGVTDFGMPLENSYPTWAELLRHSGYQTAAFIGAVVLDSRALAPGLNRGFDYYDNFPPDSGQHGHWGVVERRGGDVVHRAETWMSAHPRKPRFVWVHLYDPHDPYEPPPPYAQIYKDRLYDGEVAYADSALAGLLQYLKREHRYQNALIIVVGDHGEGLGEHGEQTHGIFLYDSTTHVPLIFKLPMSSTGKVVDAPVVDVQISTTDILPTVLDLLSIVPPPALAEHSLRAYFTATNTSERKVFGETDYPLHFGWAPLRAIRSGGYQFIEAPRPELYDLANDPAEQTNVYEPWNATVQKLRTDLASSALRPPRAVTSRSRVSEQTLSELRALGYLGSADEKSSTNVPELSFLPDPKDKIEEQNMLHSAMLAVDQGHSADAELLLQKVLQLNADSPSALRQIGELEFKAGDYRNAADHLARLRTTHPEDASAALYEGKALYQLGDLTGAQKALQAAVAHSTGQVEARLLLANIDLQSGNAAAAEDQFEAVLLAQSANREALLGLAHVYRSQRRYADIVDLLQPQAQDASVSAAELEALQQAYVSLGRMADANKVRAQITRHHDHP